MKNIIAEYLLHSGLDLTNIVPGGRSLLKKIEASNLIITLAKALKPV